MCLCDVGARFLPHVFFPSIDQKWKCWDLGGQGRYRDLWPRYYSRSSAVVMVVDAQDAARLGTLRDEFHRIVNHKGMSAVG